MLSFEQQQRAKREKHKRKQEENKHTYETTIHGCVISATFPSHQECKKANIRYRLLLDCCSRIRRSARSYEKLVILMKKCSSQSHLLMATHRWDRRSPIPNPQTWSPSFLKEHDTRVGGGQPGLVGPARDGSMQALPNPQPG